MTRRVNGEKSVSSAQSWLVSLVLAVALLVGGCTSPGSGGLSAQNAPGPKAVRVVLDMDADFDDLIASLLLAQSHQPLVGVSVEKTGWGLPEFVSQHAAQALMTAGDCVKIIEGGDRISKVTPVDLPKFAKLQHRVNTEIQRALGDRAACPTMGQSDNPIAELVGPADDVIIVATGPLTNVARFLASDKDRVRRIYFTAGSVGKSRSSRYPGNVDLDPVAAAQVFATRVPVVLVDDRFIFQTPEPTVVAGHLMSEHSPSARLARSLLMNVRDGGRGASHLYVWDAVTALVRIDYPGFVQSAERANMRVHAAGHSHYTWKEGDQDLVLTSPKPGGFTRLLLKHLR